MSSPILPGALLAALAALATLDARDDSAVAREAAAVPRDSHHARGHSDSGAVIAVVRRFHDALASGDSGAALSLLAEDVVIIESGDVETREQYRSHHLAADVAFARAVPSTPGPSRIRVQGDVAWVSSTSITEGTYKGRAVNSVGAELAVLSRAAGRWTVRAIHWSSHPRRSAALTRRYIPHFGESPERHYDSSSRLRHLAGVSTGAMLTRSPPGSS